jgi:hypothetical protein
MLLPLLVRGRAVRQPAAAAAAATSAIASLGPVAAC